MPRPANMPQLPTIGARVLWWRKFRKLKRRELAKLCGMAYSTLADLENGTSNAGRFLHMIAAHLRLNAHYVETGKGEPEAEFAQEAPEDFAWPFPGVSRSKLDKLNTIERSYVEKALYEALDMIEKERRKSRSA